MKNLLESFAVFLVATLSILIIFLIVQYNMIDETTEAEEIVYVTPKEETKKVQTENYLDSLEGYGEDVDVKVDATKESYTNTVVVKSELSSDSLSEVVTDKAKTSYMENLANYAEEAENDEAEEELKKAMDSTEKAVVVDPLDPEKLEHDEVSDEIGSAIDSLLDDL